MGINTCVRVNEEKLGLLSTGAKSESSLQECRAGAVSSGRASSGRAGWPGGAALSGGFARRMTSLPGPSAAGVKDCGWSVSHRGQFSKDLNVRVKHQKEGTKKEGADEMSDRCRVCRAKEV